MSTPEESPFDLVPEPLREALVARGFTELTSVQAAVVDASGVNGPAHDLRISSQTGSGKTVAVGLAIYPLLTESEEPGPHAIVIAPTRELAAQVQKELEWLFAGADLAVVVVSGGMSFGGELRALRRKADVVVGTPGRLLDHLTKGTIDARAVRVVVLDEADQMLDLGFREELEGILEKLPTERRTHLMSATFPRDIVDLCDRYQRDAVSVQGTRLGEANLDIAHVVHVIAPAQRNDALINLLLLAPEESTLVFVRTRVDAAEAAAGLGQLGFSAAALTGEMEQRDRTRTLDAFREGTVRVLVATDVAARGLDVPDVPRVIHADAPMDHEVYVHRSGRTGRAGKKGTSVLLVPPAMRELAARIMRRARVTATWVAAPGRREVLRYVDERIVAELSAEDAETAGDERLGRLADTLLGRVDARELVMRLLARSKIGAVCPPRDVAAIHPQRREDDTRDGSAPRREGPPAPRRGPQGEFLPFHVNWGTQDGADPRRLLAFFCRRGGIRGGEVGAIQVGERESVVEVAAASVEAFMQAVRRPDPRDPHLRISPFRARPARRPPTPPEEPSPRPAPPNERSHGRKDRPTHEARAKKR